ncbi:T9SS type A sorting domain-containing protein [Polaribacter sp. SA4-12]|uniref:T9SS type A sorting domain-containing protein n=1 Tax=Polaribacter sp. SA4-12 TaxID=1312072 RepID=UPI0018DF7DCF|nr:T9SS type A sorting domain-containing protein [Polaribacter sp. SA4-12]
MSFFKNNFLPVLLLLFCFELTYALQPPTPPSGKVWVLNHEMSDEFDVNSPDISKWNVFDKGNSWDRTSAFDKRIHEAVKDPNSDNYYLSMNPMWYYEDERFTSSGGRTYNFAGGGMDTHTMQTYGYFEVRIKPSDFPMGSGVFMNSRGTTGGSCNQKYATELDIIENMGYTGPGAGSFNNYQHVNSHAKPYSDASGSCETIKYESTNSGVSGKPLEKPLDFNTVGMWWKDEDTAEFYNNGDYFGTITPTRDFYLPMPIILTMETYGWGNDENNATNPKPVEWMFEDSFRSKEQRAVLYDWVRVWKLTDIDATVLNDGVNNVKGLVETINEYPTNKLSATVIYSATANKNVVATLYDPSNNVLAVQNFEVTKGVRSIFTEFNLDSDLAIANNYKIVFEIKEGTTLLTSDTTIVNIVTKPLEKKLWRDGIPTSLVPGFNTYDIDVKYETDVNSTLVIEVRKPDGSWFGGGNKNVTAGNGVATVTINTPQVTTVAANYFYKVYMYRQGMDWRDPLNVSISPTIYFNVEEPITPSISITSAPTEFKQDISKIDVEFNYATTKNGILNIELINNLDQVVASETRTERIGSRTLTRSVTLNSIINPGDDYKITVKFSPEDGSFEDLIDTVYNVNVTGDVVSVDDFMNSNDKMSIYPNPTKGALTINLDVASMVVIQQIEVFSLDGKKVTSFNLEEKKSSSVIDVSQLEKGVYFVKVITNKLVYSKIFIKK